MSEPIKYFREPPLSCTGTRFSFEAKSPASTTVKNSSTMRKKMLLNTPASPPSRLPATPTSLLGLRSSTSLERCSSGLLPTDSQLNGQGGQFELWAAILQQGRELMLDHHENRGEPGTTL